MPDDIREIRRPQLRLGDLMRIVAASAIIFGLIRVLGGSLALFLVWLAALIVPFCLPDRGKALRIRRRFWASALATNGLIAALCVYERHISLSQLIVIVSLISTLVILPTWIPWVYLIDEESDTQSRRPVLRILLSLVVVVGPTTMVFSHWPLWLAFAVSRPWLEGLADGVASGRPIAGTTWAGLLRLTGSQVDPSNGNVALLTESGPGLRAGFLRMPTRDANPRGPFDNFRVDLPLGERWRFQYEDSVGSQFPTSPFIPGMTPRPSPGFTIDQIGGGRSHTLRPPQNSAGKP